VRNSEGVLKLEILTELGVTAIVGLLGIMAFYFSFSKKPSGFYKETNDGVDTTGLFIIVGWILMGLHKLYKITFRNHHIFAPSNWDLR